MEIVKAVLIHLVVPAAGLQWFLWLRDDMREDQVESPPVLQLFIIFATYGGLVMMALTALFWYWSGMASLGLAYLLFIAPPIMLVTAWRLYPQRGLSRYHKAAFVASVSYVVIVACSAVLVVIWKYLSGHR